MKTKLLLLLFLFIFTTLPFLPNSFAQITASDNRVRLIYFVPRQRQPQQDIDTKLDALIKNVQVFFADEMERHGFGRKTFEYEMDRDGNAVVHHVNGRYLDAHYHHHTENEVNAEVSQQFDFSKNVYLMVVDISTEFIDGVCGKGGEAWNGVGDWGGRAYIPASGDCLDANFGIELTAHELGHAFGVFHDFSSDAYIMSYGVNRVELARCTAEWLDAHRYFNSRQTPTNRNETDIQMLPPLLSSPYAVRLRFTVSDPDGLQRAQLLTPATSKYEAPGQLKILGCKKLEGERQTVEFVTTKLTTQSESVTFRIIDGAGNFAWKENPIDIDGLFPSSRGISIPDANLAAVVRDALGLRRFGNITQLDMLKLTGLFADNREIENLTGLEHARNLKYLSLNHNQINDIAVLAPLTNLAALSLSFNQISDFAPIAKLTNLMELDISENMGNPITPVTELTQLQTIRLRGYRIQDLTPFTRLTNLRHLGLGNNQISDLTPVTELTQLRNLWIGENQVQDLTPLAELIHLEWLDLSLNQISDIKPLENLTQLRILQLPGNQISDLTPLAELDDLTYLILSDNQISDLTPVTALTNLEALVANSNRINDIAPLTRLKQLTTLWLVNNQVSSFRPLTQLFNLVELKVAGNPIADRTSLQTLLRRNSALKLDIDPSQLFPVVLFSGNEPPPMYWTDAETSGFYRLAGTKKTVENAALGIQNITALAIDVGNGKLYWAEKTSDRTGRIQRANLDGTKVQLVKDLTSVPLDIVLDTADGILYLTNTWGKTQRLNVNGSNFQPNLITDLDMPNHIALDVAGSKLYWTEAGERIRRANLDGSNIETLGTDFGTLGGIAVATGKLYWTEQTGESTGKIQCANLDGTSVETLASLRSIPFGIVVDTAERKLYWTNTAGKIQRANLNGKKIETLIVGLGEPRDLAMYTRTVATAVATAPTLVVLPDTTSLLSNYPNPFNPETWIPYQLAEPVDVTLRIYTANGVLVRTLALGQLPAGIYQSRSRAAYWNGRNEIGEPVASGIYFYTLSAGDFTATRKMLIRK